MQSCTETLIACLLMRFRPLLPIKHSLDPRVRRINDERHHCDDQKEAKNNETKSSISGCPRFSCFLSTLVGREHFSTRPQEPCATSAGPQQTTVVLRNRPMPIK